jgi:hypothetical protein
MALFDKFKWGKKDSTPDEQEISETVVDSPEVEDEPPSPAESDQFLVVDQKENPAEETAAPAKKNKESLFEKLKLA